MKKINWLLGALLLALTPILQSCDDDDGYSIGDFSWDWATVHATGGGRYYLDGDRWGVIEPVATAIPWYKPIDGKRVIAFFNPLMDTTNPKGVQVKMEGVEELLTKEVEKIMTMEDDKKFGNDPIVIKEGNMWLGGKHLNLIFRQDLPRSKKHLISLVQNKMNVPKKLDKDGYLHLELRYNTYGDVTGYWGDARVSYNLERLYPSVHEADKMKGFIIKINSKDHGEGVLLKLDFDHPVAVPESAKDVHSGSSIQ